MACLRLGHCLRLEGLPRLDYCYVETNYRPLSSSALAACTSNTFIHHCKSDLKKLAYITGCMYTGMYTPCTCAHVSRPLRRIHNKQDNGWLACLVQKRIFAPREIHEIKTGSSMACNVLLQLIKQQIQLCRSYKFLVPRPNWRMKRTLANSHKWSKLKPCTAFPPKGTFTRSQPLFYGEYSIEHSSKLPDRASRKAQQGGRSCCAGGQTQRQAPDETWPVARAAPPAQHPHRHLSRVLRSHHEPLCVNRLI